MKSALTVLTKDTVVFLVYQVGYRNICKIYDLLFGEENAPLTTVCTECLNSNTKGTPSFFIGR